MIYILKFVTVILIYIVFLKVIFNIIDKCGIDFVGFFQELGKTIKKLLVRIRKVSKLRL